jgi:hypothetical protein
MRRSIEQAFAALREQIDVWAKGEAKPGVRVFVYPPEWEAVMLARFPAFADERAAAGRPIALVDVGQVALAEVERRRGFVASLTALEAEDTDRVLHDLGVVAGRALLRVLKEPLAPPAICRLLINTGALGTFVSYSAITNDLFGAEPGGSGVVAPSILAFPGEGDERSLNLLGLRVDTNYRVPRI